MIWISCQEYAIDEIKMEYFQSSHVEVTVIYSALVQKGRLSDGFQESARRRTHIFTIDHAI